MLVAQRLAADTQDHRAMPVDQGRESGRGFFAPPVNEPLEQLAVDQSRGRARMEQGFDLLERIHRWTRW